MKIALVCTSLGYSWRGFERFSLELFDLVKEELPITLFGCRSNGRPNEISLPCLKHDRFLRFLQGKTRDNYYFQQFSYALSFIPFVVWHEYDIVHCSEPALGHFLFHAKRKFKFRYKLLFTDGLGLHPALGRYSPERWDHIQTITLPHYHWMIHAGVKPAKISFLPYGVDSNRYQVRKNKKKLRDQYGIPEEKIVILSVAALNRRHKRIDYLIREVHRLGKDYFLLIVGQPEEPDLVRLGRESLDGNFKSLYVPFDQIAEIYHLADLFVFPCLIGEFGLALAEAMCAELPVIAHRHFQWIVEEPRCLADLAQEGNLAKKIDEVVENFDTFRAIAERNRTRTAERFDWNHLKEGYLRMYERVFSNAS